MTGDALLVLCKNSNQSLLGGQAFCYAPLLSSLAPYLSRPGQMWVKIAHGKSVGLYRHGVLPRGLF